MENSTHHRDRLEESDLDQELPPGLYLVSTPIGNLADLSRRAEAVLRAADHVAAEDTRRTGGLLKHLGIEGRLTSLHAHNEAARLERVLDWLGSGARVALVTDAGTPLISDPGGRIVSAASEAGFPVIPIPGPSAALAALVASGLPCERFAFLGFPPRKGRAREEFLQRIEDSAETCVVFESPERLASLLDELARRSLAGRRAAVARELTKLHEEIRRGTVEELARYYSGGPPRGEVTVVIDRAPEGTGVGEEEARALADQLLGRGMSPSRTARELADRLGVSRNQAYQWVQAWRES